MRDGSPRLFLVIFLGGLASWTAARLWQRYREERADRRVAILADWYEARDLADRAGMAEADVLRSLRRSGVQGLLLSPVTLADLHRHHRVVSRFPLAERDPLDTAVLVFKEPALARQAQREMQRRGAPDIQVASEGSSTRLSRLAGSFFHLRDVDLGLDPVLIGESRALGLALFSRLNRDPWTTPAQVESALQEDGMAPLSGVVFNTDEVPGGLEAMPLWRSWLLERRPLQAVFEFHASPAAIRMAKQAPAAAYRAHAISSQELKNLAPEQELARWRRAVRERSCRLLLFHASPNDSWPSFLARLTRLQDWLLQAGWIGEIPVGRRSWQATPLVRQRLQALLAFSVAVCVPWVGLFFAYSAVPRERGLIAAGLVPFWASTITTLGGALFLAVVAQNPETRLALTPFRGIKPSFLLSWLGTIFILYNRKEIRMFLDRSVRRRDVIVGLVFLGMAAYALIRSGNASGGWRSPIEQGVRDHLEGLLVARPRFKEFLWGHPLMILGFYAASWKRPAARTLDGRPLIILGMIGQASIMNTFCHLHSPLSMALGRTAAGALLGSVLGGLVVVSARPFLAKPVKP